MCDHSLHTVKSRPAKAGETLTTRDFQAGTSGFAASEDPKCGCMPLDPVRN